jgi:glucosamine-phosphate N-acetyltransferase
MIDIIIRILRKSDCSDFLDLLNTFRPIDKAVVQNNFDMLYNVIFQNSIIFVIEYNKKIIGTAKLVKEQKFYHNMALYGSIEDVIIDPMYRGKQLGKQLIQYIIEYGKTIKLRKIRLNCDEKVLNFYIKNKFSVNGVNMVYNIS